MSPSRETVIIFKKKLDFRRAKFSVLFKNLPCRATEENKPSKRLHTSSRKLVSNVTFQVMQSPRCIQIQLGSESNTVIEKILSYLVHREYQTIVSYIHEHAMK